MKIGAYLAISSLSARIAPACFQSFRPIFEFTKSKCPTGAECKGVTS